MGTQRLEEAHQGSQSLFGVGEVLKLSGGTYRDHHLFFGDIDADEALWFFHGMLLLPFLAVMRDPSGL